MVVLAIPLLGVVLASVLFWRRQFGAQVLARAFCWSALALGFLVVMATKGEKANTPLLLCLCSGAALLAAGRHGLSVASRAGSRFSPAAFAGPLTAGLVLAIADLQTLLMWGAMATTSSSHHIEVFRIGMFTGAAVMFVAIIGVYRLKMWGILLNLAANVAIATFAIFASEVPPPIAWTLSATALMQFLLPIPMLISLSRKTATPDDPEHSSRGYALVPCLLIVLMVAAVALRDVEFF